MIKQKITALLRLVNARLYCVRKLFATQSLSYKRKTMRIARYNIHTMKVTTKKLIMQIEFIIKLNIQQDKSEWFSNKTADTIRSS
jgi:hypothetical protein